MAVYAVGDIQGCYDELRHGLDQVGFEPGQDQLWLVGDLVNRGPKSLEVLRYVKGLGDSAVAVLGNHDLHLLALGAGNRQKDRNEESLQPIFDATDRDELLYWLRHRPLMHHDPQLDFVMLHAGLPPQWDIDTASACAREVEHVLRNDGHVDYFMHMYGNKPKRWNDTLSGIERLRFITNCFTRLRFCARDGELALKEKGPPGSQRSGYIPWFQHPERASRKQRILFGHWSTLGYHTGNNVWALDTGCLWGGPLTLLRIDGQQLDTTQFPCKGQQNPAAFV